jgi:SAM-dependent methyltransferase
VLRRCRLYDRRVHRGRAPAPALLRRQARETIGRYGLELAPAEADAEAARFAEQASWLEGARSVLDIGGGYSPFAVLLAEHGARVTVLDDFEHPYFSEHDQHRAIVAGAGVELIRRDAVSGEALPFEDASFEAVTSFDSMEHWHHSPRRLFHDVLRVLTPAGRFVLGVPNAVNLRKRLTVPIGRSNWAHFEDWYDEPVFFGHVREPTVSDLERIARDLGLSSWRVLGRNWLGYRGSRKAQLAARLIDAPLRLRPSFCANLYLVGRR